MPDITTPPPRLRVLVREGRVLARPAEITVDDAGARDLAELYAMPADRVHVRAMMNTSIDGSIIGADGTSAPLRNPTDSFAFGVLRALTDVIVAGAQTVRLEDYRRPLGRASLLEPSRRPTGASRPALAIITRSGRIPTSVRADWPTYLLTPARHVEAAARTSGLPQDQVIAADSPAQMVRALADRGMRAIQCEGGPEVLSAWAHQGVLDELCLSVSHVTVGGQGPRPLYGPPLDQAWALRSLVLGPHAQLTRYDRSLAVEA